ncbi:GNAT family N-acetyltransferase [Paenibacillus sabinae]|uniref:GCN5-like N-acetyltransferase n=1 Tax=Paenibacillus sabinae T27 TaxID=1268072 RepID=X4ZIT8_9BACL|nr:GNAT family N-acetyltransferase [Paenibacillus sabinae]AHV96630.1 GCN5-like N-acetyltransferase [Paenibacillus sabinae T27]
MRISSVYAAGSIQWSRQQGALLAFLRRHAGQRIPTECLQTLADLTPGRLSAPGTSLLTATLRDQLGTQLAALSLVTDYGKEACVIAVHPLYRNKGIGASLMREQVKRLGTLECRVTPDHASGLKMCFNAGLAAVALTRSASGAPVLRLRSFPAGFLLAEAAEPDAQRDRSPILLQEGESL